jgi:hypothetical protein
MLKFHFKFPCLDGLIQTRVLNNQSTRYIGYMLFYNCMQWRSQNDNWGGGHIHIFAFCFINFF